MGTMKEAELPEAHFDDETFKEGQKRLINHRKKLIAALKKEMGRKPRELFGRATHTLQEFYSYTNWVELGLKERSTVGMATVGISSGFATTRDCWNIYDTSYLHGLHNLGSLYSDQGKLTEDEAMYQRALAGKEKALGPEHTSTLNTVDNLSSLYRDQGGLVEAEAMYQRALVGNEKALGPERMSTLQTVNNLGSLYRDQGRLAEAEAMYQRALAGHEKVLSPEYMSVLNTIGNLGNLYYDQGKLVEAEAMYLRALGGSEKALGPEPHVDSVNY